MKFDVIIGNPPYQIETGGAQAQAIPLYHKFIQQAKKLNPKYITMIIPSRWFCGGMGLNSFRDEMLNDNRLRIIHDFFNARDCFPSVEIKGGVCYFLWERDHSGLCKVFSHENNEITSVDTRPLLEKNIDIFIRYNKAIPILHKVLGEKNKSFMDIVSTQKPFGLSTNYHGKKEVFKDSVKLYATKEINYIKQKEVISHIEWLKYYKIYVPKAVGSGDIRTDVLKPLLGEPNSCCTETYTVIGPFFTKEEACNAISYINTKFFHFLLGLRKITQDTLRKVYQFVPLQNFNESWTDEKLYKKYELSKEEIDFIESMIKSME